MTNSLNTLSNLSVGHILPNCWTVMAYAVSDRHAVLLCSMSRQDEDGEPIAEYGVRFATWTVSNDDLRSTAGGNYFGSNLANGMELAWADYKARVADMHIFS